VVNGPAPCADPESTSSRRALLRATGLAAAGGSAALVAACSARRTKPAPVESPGAKPSALRADRGILQSALDLEHRAIAAYTAGIPLLDARTRGAARQFLLQEFAHAAELSALIHQGGGKPNPPSPSYDLGSPASAGDVLGLLHTIERASIAAYLVAIPRLSPGIVRSTVASILANEAEHVSVLRVSLRSQAVPSAFVTASE
jgi:ferritin-like protein